MRENDFVHPGKRLKTLFHQAYQDVNLNISVRFIVPLWEMLNAPVVGFGQIENACSIVTGEAGVSTSPAITETIEGGKLPQWRWWW
jgi:hypothetical protein